MHYLTLIFLWPIYLVQAIWVKKTTVKLPEPSGERANASCLTPQLSLLIIGDSAAAGVGVNHQQQALAGNMVKRLSADYQLNWQLVAQSGYSTQNCLNQVKHLLRQNRLPQADAIVISLGVNDVLSPISAKTWVQQLSELCALITAELGSTQIIITNVPPMDRFPALPQPFRWFLGARCREFNLALSNWVTTSSLPCEQLNMEQTLADAPMAIDGFHPSEVIYAHWGQQASEMIKAKV
ncbi:SGNH/GDSL hydrolase family protein [Shewanella sp. UCD-KL21]|uniref:SGNH/GDSL hydrolase family protein n=1 Tax=Shewanella sp. UCD-KL21 TaxID=1917164 RepID=UPI0009707DDB|nr:SGNH/GDSL hydrolase family protein [Shewanella sp. UCD-KL21]